ncbi:predicted protein [Scheffersomyces stipitis CBS 6054]|uniref:HTH CENPB-type domain-containing protein n=1 Tax=Scheffersomyces stipitis (strain ATCC 58785 / CBS 6054 / NBRC 10063 / NRRL Y-11545) TaxID=322104 RepID=A3LZF4_PICST|nr:predicted protein [Scheffersomyces stipitis CBS 6054]ABN68326.2 predicted protein [Scheffersomyces stipitis CBS 6054]KAG2734842.1 hypothetical protein G9P44_002848 [Scheffersomyces stipitis]
MPPVKLPRATLEQKIQILDFYHQSNRPQSETVDRYKNEISISTSSFSEWLKNEDDLRERLSSAGSSFSKKSRRKVKFKYEEINRAMDMLVKRRLERNEPINEPILREHWSIFAHQYGVEDPKRLVGFSHGWLSQFKKRHGLNKKRMSGTTVGGAGGMNHDSSSSSSSPRPGNQQPAEEVYENYAGAEQESNEMTDGNTANGNLTNPNNTNATTAASNTNNNTTVSNSSATNNTSSSNNRSNDHSVNGNPPSNSPATEFASATAANSSISSGSTQGPGYDLLNPQLANPANASGTNSTGASNQFRPHQGLSFSNGNGNLNLNYVYKQQQQLQSHSQQAQAQRPAQTTSQSQKSHPSRLPQRFSDASDTTAPASYDYQQQLRARYERHQIEQRLTRSGTRGTSSSKSQTSNRAGTASTANTGNTNNNNSTPPTTQAPTTHASLDTAPTAGTSTGSSLDVTSTISGSDIERFIYMFADRFFHDHQYEYPQTVAIFQEFKNSFFNERMINLRSIQQQQQQQQAQHVQHHAQQQQAQQQEKQQQAQQQHQQLLHQVQQMQQASSQQHITNIDDFFLRNVPPTQTSPPSNSLAPVNGFVQSSHHHQLRGRNGNTLDPLMNSSLPRTRNPVIMNSDVPAVPHGSKGWKDKLN